ncbi:4-alpha-glucanotransferase [Cohaesibacter sp. ES.047]|uniref:4-alpha-glucanotransferase n=1 Tax=Cohaesibacter sp. ES.047 TaxID=1798205 RepID=UPI000BB7A644|nr:4-alpha-glucanotransferase [Cohaesibacter sp. ES.047]SNY93242.1 4-alpha-glucanotransferase [Cohaesibacter sp. ES.047]
MTVENLNALAAHFGIHPFYYDFDGHQVHTSPETQRALLQANGLQLDNDAMIKEAVDAFVLAEQDRWFPRELITSTGYGYECHFGLGARWHIRLDDRVASHYTGAPLSGIADTHISLPPLPAGIHDLVCEVGDRVEIVTIISAPILAPSIEQLGGGSRIWGVTVPQYGIRSDRNSGIGDYVDLANMVKFIEGLGGSFIGINPVHSLGFSDPYAISPYSPSHRGFFNTQHIATDAIPGIKGSPQAQSILQAVETQWKELRASERVDYIPHRTCHNAALRDLYTIFLQHAEPQARQAYEAFKERRGDYLQRFALFEALAERYGQEWQKWPAPLRDRDPKTLEDATDQFSARIEFYCWLQWVANVQLGEAQTSAKDNGSGMGLYLDLAVGSRRDGAESWCEYDSVAHGVSLGAPPDQLGPDGQNWGLMTYAPRKLAETRYKSLRHIFRSAMRYAGILRIDHVLGLNRSFWIPEDGNPGAYVTQPLDTLLAILSIEANETKTAIIGEDLGLVPDGFRDQVQSRGIYGYSVLQYEKWDDGSFKHPNDLRKYSLACFSTHDTPTLKGFMSGTDIKWRDRLAEEENRQSDAALEQRQADVQALAQLDPDPARHEDLSFEHLFEVVHGSLAHSDVAMIALSLDDILSQEEAQNLPGTIDQHPNWRRKCPLTLDEMHEEPAFESVSEMMEEAGRNIHPSPSLQVD